MTTKTSFSLAGIVAALFLATAVPAHAVLLDKGFVAQNFLDTPLGGTTVVARPELAGTVLEDVLTPFSFGALNISGNVQNRVVREDGTGTLDFYWRVTIDPRSTGGGVSAFRLIDFGYDSIVDGDWRQDGLGSAAPFIGRVFNPAGFPSGAINFLFTDPAVQPGDPSADSNGSMFFFLHTDATHYAMTAAYDLLGGPSQALSGTFSTFAPSAVPEPSSYLLMGVGLGAVGFAARRRRNKAAA